MTDRLTEREKAVKRFVINGVRFKLSPYTQYYHPGPWWDRNRSFSRRAWEYREGMIRIGIWLNGHRATRWRWEVGINKNGENVESEEYSERSFPEIKEALRDAIRWLAEQKEFTETLTCAAVRALNEERRSQP